MDNFEDDNVLLTKQDISDEINIDNLELIEIELDDNLLFAVHRS